MENGHFSFHTETRAYACALIIHSQTVDPWRTVDMVEKEENAQQHFEVLKDIVQMFSPGWWEKNFKDHVDEFIRDHLIEKKLITAVPCKSIEEENDRIHLHGLWHLVIGAV